MSCSKYLVTDEKVFRLDVPVDNVLGVAVSQRP
jgi:hypothetical protein